MSIAHVMELVNEIDPVPLVPYFGYVSGRQSR